MKITVCEDLSMHYADAISLDILDMMQEKARNKLRMFAESFFETTEKRCATSKLFQPLTFGKFVYQPAEPETKIDTKGKKVLVLTDAYNSNTNLDKMIEWISSLTKVKILEKSTRNYRVWPSVW